MLFKHAILALLTLSFLIPTTAEAWRQKQRKPKKVVKEIQKKAPNDVEFFLEAFPNDEELKHEERTTGSLWVDSYASHLYKNLHRASRVGDMVTVIISELAQGTKTAETKTEKKASQTLSIAGLFGMLSRITSAITGLDPSKTLDTQNDNKHEGKGETRRRGSLDAKITARIIKVLKNGDMMIRGQKNIKVNGEEQSLILEGFIRPYDIKPNNTIESTYVADARITFNGFGAIADKQKPGWLTRILDHIMPF